MRWRAICAALAAATLVVRPVDCQAADSVAVRVIVRDTSGRVIPAVAVSIVRGLRDGIASGTTDDHGGVRFVVPASSADYQLVARKIGYLHGDRFFRASTDSASFDVVLRRAIQTLDPVTVTADEDVKRKSYHIGADEIANSGRVLIDATDILSKLRPDMICGRGCSPLGGVRSAVSNPQVKCPVLVFQQKQPRSCPVDNSPPPLETNVWVNGRRIRTVAPNEMALARQSGILSGLKPGTMTVLSEIAPEHIAEITYADSFDMTVGKIGSQDAIFIVLKAGIGYEPGRGSYVLPEQLQAATHSDSEIPAFRHRLLGVFDEATGDPIVDARVADVQSGTSAQTTATGTVSLIFLPEGATRVRISKPGYVDLDIVVEISPETATPLTLIMGKRPH